MVSRFCELVVIRYQMKKNVWALMLFVRSASCASVVQREVADRRPPAGVSGSFVYYYGIGAGEQGSARLVEGERLPPLICCKNRSCMWINDLTRQMFTIFSLLHLSPSTHFEYGERQRDETGPIKYQLYESISIFKRHQS